MNVDSCKLLRRDEQGRFEEIGTALERLGLRQFSRDAVPAVPVSLQVRARMDSVVSTPPLLEPKIVHMDEMNEADSSHVSSLSSVAEAVELDTVPVSADVPSDITLILELVGSPEKDISSAPAPISTPTLAPRDSAVNALEVSGEDQAHDVKNEDDGERVEVPCSAYVAADSLLQ